MQTQSETIQAKTAGLALYLGNEAGIKGTTLDFFVNFIAQRFPDQQDEYYILEWATRLISGTAWSAADNASKRVMLRIAKEMKLKHIPNDWVLDDDRVTF